MKSIRSKLTLLVLAAVLCGALPGIICCVLQNGFDRAVGTLIMVMCAAAFVFALIAARFAGSIADPIRKLAAATKGIAEGRYDAELPDCGCDEVGELARAIGNTNEALKRHIDTINMKAFRDGLTGVRNKAAAAAMMDDMDAQMAEGKRDFAIGMFDLNDLKTMNDVYGHARGDDYLKNACMLVCHTFTHSPVFRIGGDEFIAVIQGEDLLHVDERVSDFQKQMEQLKDAENPWDRISIAMGIACCEEGDAKAGDVFNRADRRMYENKNEMKGAASRTSRTSEDTYGEIFRNGNASAEPEQGA